MAMKRSHRTLLPALFFLSLVLAQWPPHSFVPLRASAAATKPPVLAFYYMWYNHASWCLCRMSDLPTVLYDSSAVATIDRQVREASGAGIDGFISSWMGPGDPTDHNFSTLLQRAAVLERHTGVHFVATIYLESDAPALRRPAAIAKAIHYILTRYGRDPHFFHWHGKPVIFIWDPLGGGRTLADWATIRAQSDASHHSLWSAEGTDMSLLSVFDGIHLFSAGYWGLLSGTMNAVDAGFRAKVNAYNAAHGTGKIWAAGVEPGYNDTRVPGRVGAYIVPRDNGATYRTSWTAAVKSRPDWITITTFNEWSEGAMIEASIHYGDLYLKLTRQLTSSR